MGRFAPWRKGNGRTPFNSLGTEALLRQFAAPGATATTSPSAVCAWYSPMKE